MLGSLTKSDFDGYLGETFLVHHGAPDPLEMLLIEVTALASAPAAASGRREPFSLLFRGPNDAALDQGIYGIEHAGIGTLDLFLVPVGSDQQGMRYEAIFN